MPPRAFGSEPRPAPSLPAPEPSPCNPLPGPLPLPIPPPPPLPPSPLFAVPFGDMASEPPPPEFGKPGLFPGWLERTTAVPAALPALLGGATEEPMSSGPPRPVPFVPRPMPEEACPPPNPGGGGTTSAAPSCAPPFCPEDEPEPLPRCEPTPPMLAGGGTTCVANPEPAPDREDEPPPAAVGGGGTGFSRKSPEAVLPQLLRSRLTCDGGGATTAGAGNVIFGVDDTSRAGAETGGATTSTVWLSGTRELARSRGVSRGAGATTVGASGFVVRIWSRDTFGAGGTTAALKAGELRLLERETSGAGGTMFVVRLLEERPGVDFNSGEGAIALSAGRTGAVRDERRPSAGGGPGFGLKASRLATAESECGRLILGASTTFSVGLSPRATRMVCVR